MSDDQLIKLYKQLDSILDIYNGWMWQDVFRYIGSGIVDLLIMLNGLLENIVDKVITFNNFYSSKGIQDFMDTSRPIVWGLFLVALIFLGFQIMLNKVEKRNDLVLNVILAVCMIVIIPDLMVNMGKITDAGVKAISPDSSKLSEEIVKSNVADVLYYAQNDFTFSSNKNGTESSPPRPISTTNSSAGTTDYTNANKISTGAINYINFAEKLDLQEDDGWFFKEDWVKGINDNSKDVLKKKMAATGEGDKFVVRDLDGNSIPGTTLGQESYYRYHVNWGTLIFSLLVTTIALGITILKVGRATFDLAFHQIFGMYVAVTDLSGGQRTKKILIEIVSTFSIIYIMVLLLKLFIMYANWVGGLKGDIGSLGVLLLLVSGAWALIDAPDIVQRMLGIDAGLRSGAQTLMGAYAASKIPFEGLKTAKKGLESLSNMFGKDRSNQSPTSHLRDGNGLNSQGKELAREPVKPVPSMNNGNMNETSAGSPNSNNPEKAPIDDTKENQDGIPSSETNMDNKENQGIPNNNQVENQVPKMPKSMPNIESLESGKNDGVTPSSIPNTDMGETTDMGELKQNDISSMNSDMDSSTNAMKEMASAIDNKDSHGNDMAEIPSDIQDGNISDNEVKEMPSAIQDIGGSDISSNSNNVESSQMNIEQQSGNVQSKKMIPPINDGYSLGNSVRGIGTNIQQSNSSLRSPTIEQNEVKKFSPTLENKGGIDE